MAPKLEDIWYTRPKAVREQSITSISSSQYSGRSGSSSGVPEGLQLQLVLDGRTCPPCSIRDFNVIHPFEYVFNGHRNILIVSNTLERILPSIFGSKAFIPSDDKTDSKDYKKRFFEMPIELQELSPRPDFDSVDVKKQRIPKLAVRGRPADQPSVAAMTTPTTPVFRGEKESKESLRSCDERTLSPLSPNAQSMIAPLEKDEFETRSSTTRSDGLSTTTKERLSSETANQPFRHEVCLIQGLLFIID